MKELTKASATVFVASSWLLFFSKEHGLGAEWREMSTLRGKIKVLSNVQMLAIFFVLVSLVMLLSFAGAAFVQANMLVGDTVKNKTKPGPSTFVRIFSIMASLWSVGYCFQKFVQRLLAQRDIETWPASFGLFCGLGSVAVAQVCLFFYHYVNREMLSLEGKRIQTRELTYSRAFVGDVLHHLSNPGAFILMLPYLCLTWMFRLMPDSYYNYDPSVNWLNVLLQLLCVDFFTFTFHVLEHSIPEFYKVSHKPHHRFFNPHMFNAFDGSLADTTALILFPLFTTAQLLHVNNWDYVAFGTVYSTHFMMIHSEFEHLFDPLLKAFYVNIASDHHVHHAYIDYNFAHFFSIYDVLFGTYRDGATCKHFRENKQLNM